MTYARVLATLSLLVVSGLVGTGCENEALVSNADGGPVDAGSSADGAVTVDAPRPDAALSDSTSMDAVSADAPRQDAAPATDVVAADRPSSDTALVDARGDGPPAPAAVWPADATKLVAENRGGGFGLRSPPGSACERGAALYTLAVATRVLQYKVCVEMRPMPSVWGEGMKVLSESDYAQVDAAMKKVVVTTRMACGADKPTVLLKVTSPAGELEYLDSFYVCNKQGTYVDNIDEPLRVLASLAR